MWECFYYSCLHTWYTHQWVYDAIQNLEKWGVISKTFKNCNLCWCYSGGVIINVKFILVGEKLQWFQSHLDPNKIEYTKKEAGELIEK